ncbi:hypothetical protein HUK65_03115 [Rhodobacteraceae bacterium 2376]|uniref:PhiE125 gp8 family phage protein n=1 Tax=Rhabdonatronobacter sediminivivens TaxID=2743469 RepID=A0A7Z0HY18_9RHOB|nr:hypothetical protein [Rhabdonatronobacter sediminivivens]NYS23969.1 hypothetical protein [Rhabdonatronobacter sediminivivens]
MELIETGGFAPEALPVVALREHLRMGSGFADDASQDGLLAQYLRAAMATVEARTGKVLLERGFELRVQGWRTPDAQVLPVAPVREVQEVALLDRAGGETLVDPARWRLLRDQHRPVLAPMGVVLPVIGWGGGAVIRFTAGFGPEWADLPADLAQAVLMLAARHYEDREAGGALPMAVASILERWRVLRTGGRA